MIQLQARLTSLPVKSSDLCYATYITRLQVRTG